MYRMTGKAPSNSRSQKGSSVPADILLRKSPQPLGISKLSRTAEREAWTAFVEGRDPKPQSKYKNERKGKYASGHEAKVASDLSALAEGGKIQGLREQVPFELIPGRNKVRGITYIADFTWYDSDNVWHVGDAKGYAKNAVYLLKRKMMFLLKGITVEEL
jgi:Protein of unknown function (DUF1064)